MITSEHPSSLVIDASLMSHTDKHPSFSFEDDADRLVKWVQNYPARSSLRVYVKSSISNIRYRKLQTTLQSLGCIVVAKTAL